MQTFKFMRYSFTIIIYHDTKDARSMLEGILLLEKILGAQMFDTALARRCSTLRPRSY